MTSEFRPACGRSSVVASFFVLLSFAMPVVVRAVGPSIRLKPEHLQEAGLHLPAYMPTVRDITNFQVYLPRHQEFDMEWDALPGRTGMQRMQDLEGVPLAPNFTVLARRRGLTGSASGFSDNVNESTLIIVAVTVHNEIRGLALQQDPREGFAEDVMKQQRVDYAWPKANFYFRLPDDPQIRTIIFFKRGRTAVDGGWPLQEVGRTEVDPKH
jgi:hypothetical protein